MCYAFSLPPTAFTRQVNRATAETSQEAGLTEGLAPLMGWVKRLCDGVIQDRIGEADLEFAWSDVETIDPREQAEILQIYVKEGIKTRNEARAVLGDGPLPGADTLTVDTPHGPLPLTQAPRPSPVAKAGFNPDEPGDWHGRWTSDGGTAGSTETGDAAETKKPVQLAETQTCQDFIAENCRARILREFPGQFLHVPVDDVMKAAKEGDRDAQTARKLLNSNKYRK